MCVCGGGVQILAHIVLTLQISVALTNQTLPTMTQTYVHIPVKSTDFGGSLPIFFTFFTFLPPTYRFTTIYRFLPIFSRFYRILIFSTDLFVISCKLCSHKCYFHVLMVKSVKNFLYLNFQATCNVLAQWVKCR